MMRATALALLLVTGCAASLTSRREDAAAALRALGDRYVPADQVAHAYEDRPLPIGRGHTISQPVIVAEMTALAAVRPTSRVLEIGTGSGYQAAILAELAREAYTIEIVELLGKRAAETLRKLGY